MSKWYRCILILFCLCLHANSLRAQNSYQLDKSASSILVRGSSTFHPWTLAAEEISSDIVPILKNNSSVNLDDLYLEIPVKSLKSDKIGMNEDAHKALKAEKYPTIIFEMKETEYGSNSNEVILNITGNLEIAGVSRKIEVAASALKQDKNLRLLGSKTLRMSNFDIEPPSAFLGLLKAHDRVTVEFELVFIKKV